MHLTNFAKKNAFSLVELSIVLVILGLLVGGVLSGQSLIRAAEMRSISQQYDSFITAKNLFKDKYFGLPGDITNATQFWGVAAVGTACKTTASTDTKTCDGDGNGQIYVNGTSNERFRFWQHLANAGLITGQYSGISDYASNNYTTTVNNAPSGKLSNSLWFASYAGSITSSSNGYPDGDYGNALQFGQAYNHADPTTAIMKPTEMWNIDTKFDDAKPGTGNIVARETYTTSVNCTTRSSTADITAPYNLTADAVGCILISRNI